MVDGRNIVLLCWKTEKKAKKMRKVVQSFPGDNSTDTSNADVLYHLYCC